MKELGGLQMFFVMNMKKILSLLFMLALSAGASAQRLHEVVYLKNGSIIRGTVIEQIPGESLKIQTGDGNVFAYRMSEVEKITKEGGTPRDVRQRSGNAGFNRRGPEVGYRGFVDANWTIGVGNGAGADRIGLLTSHGYQIIPQLYIGAGAGINYYYNGTAVGMPVFADVRTDILPGSVTPFVDLKGGYSFLDVEGFYLSPSVGCRFRVGGRLAMNAGVGYTLQKFSFGINDGYDYYSGGFNIGGISIRIGIDF